MLYAKDLAVVTGYGVCLKFAKGHLEEAWKL